MTDVSEILLNAAHLLEEHGHIRGRSGNKVLGFCALGAMNTAAYELNKSESSYVQAKVRLAEHLGLAGSHMIPNWNDADQTSAEDVKLALKRAATEGV